MEGENSFKSKSNAVLEHLRSGDRVATASADISKCPVPRWFDREKFYRARDVKRDFYASIFFSHTCGLLMVFFFGKILNTLKSTGHSDSIKSLFRRYITTGHYVMNWYEGDVWDVNDPAHRWLAMVRRMHANAADKMAARNDGQLYFSQKDMALVQWAFVGPLILFPDRTGMSKCSEDDLSALVHFWRVIGYMLGIEDKYNLCRGEYEQVVERCKAVLQEFREEMLTSDPSAIEMANNTSIALSEFECTIRWPAYAGYIFDFVDLPSPIPMGWLDYVYYVILQFAKNYLTLNSHTRTLYNSYVKCKFEMSVKKVLPNDLEQPPSVFSIFSDFVKSFK